MRHEPLADRAHGKWPSILAAIGVPAKALSGKHGPCPFPGCGGKDRFRFDDKGGSGSFFCSKCGAGKGVEFVKRYLGVEFKEAAREIEKHLGTAVVMPTKAGQRSSDTKSREDLVAMWGRGEPVTLDNAAGRYLAARTGWTEFPPTLRFSPDERYFEEGKASWHPVMLARLDPSDTAREAGEQASLHRTFLDGRDGKAEVPSPRKMLGNVPTGAAVRLMQHGDVLGIAEGIETALSAASLFNVPVWASLTADLLMAWEPPASVSTVIIFADNDQSYTGQAVAYGLARKLKAKGLAVVVEVPARTGTDWNDVHREQRA